MEPPETAQDTQGRTPARLRGGTAAFLLTATVLGALALFVHVWRIGDLPNGFVIDESAIGYNAYSILRTGADEYGARYPLFFRCFDNYHEPVMVYSLVPLIKVFGLKKSVVRLPSAIFHLLASVAFGFLVQEHCRRRALALGGAFLFACLPWVFPVSRIMLAGYTAMLFGMALAWYLTLRAFRQRSLALAALGGVAWAFGMYAHNIGRPMTGVLLICLFVSFARPLMRRKAIAAVFVIAFVFALVPMMLAAWRDRAPFVSRYGQVGLLKPGVSRASVVAEVASRYWEYFTPRFLFLHGDPNLRHHAGWHGELGWFLAPVVVCGVGVMLRYARRDPRYRFLLLGIAVYPLAAALTLDHGHSTRCIQGALFFLLAGMIGFRWLLTRRRRAFRLAAAALVGLGALELSLYFTRYFGVYEQASRDHFEAASVEALDYGFRHLAESETLNVSLSTFYKRTLNAQFRPLAYAQILFFGAIDPATYQRRGLPAERVRAYQGGEAAPGLLLRASHVIQRPERKWVLNRETVPAAATLDELIPIDGAGSIEVYRVRE